MSASPAACSQQAPSRIPVEATLQYAGGEAHAATYITFTRCIPCGSSFGYSRFLHNITGADGNLAVSAAIRRVE